MIPSVEIEKIKLFHMFKFFVSKSFIRNYSKVSYSFIKLLLCIPTVIKPNDNIIKL